jgi:hypothetical protein
MTQSVREKCYKQLSAAARTIFRDDDEEMLTRALDAFRDTLEDKEALELILKWRKVKECMQRLRKAVEEDKTGWRLLRYNDQQFVNWWSRQKNWGRIQLAFQQEGTERLYGIDIEQNHDDAGFTLRLCRDYMHQDANIVCVKIESDTSGVDILASVTTLLPHADAVRPPLLVHSSTDKTSTACVDSFRTDADF